MVCDGAFKGYLVCLGGRLAQAQVAVDEFSKTHTARGQAMPLLTWICGVRLQILDEG